MPKHTLSFSIVYNNDSDENHNATYDGDDGDTKCTRYAEEILTCGALSFILNQANTVQLQDAI